MGARKVFGVGKSQIGEVVKTFILKSVRLESVRLVYKGGLYKMFTSFATAFIQGRLVSKGGLYQRVYGI